MDREQKLKILDHARTMVQRKYSTHMEFKSMEDLREAAHYATIMTAMLADLD